MTEDYETFSNRMIATYPRLFAEPFGGFAIGPGWWPIIEDLCANIQSHVDWQQEQLEKYGCGNGCQQVVVEQIKEKFGELRFYYTGGDPTIDGMVRMAECWATHTCETCGGRGEIRSLGWISTLCDKHYQEQLEKCA